MAKNLNPGTPAPKSGQYQQVGPRGGTANRPEVTVAKGERLPPTPEAGSTFTLVDPSKHS